jgi:general stress protein 26
MFITNNRENEHTRPMATVSTDDDGTLWFFTDVRSVKVEEVNTEHTVHLVYAHPGKSSYLDVWGEAMITKDENAIKEKWSAIMKAWFPNGPDDPNLALLRVRPSDVYYWDSEQGRMVAFFKIAAKALGANQVDEGVQGNLKI